MIGNNGDQQSIIFFSFSIFLSLRFDEIAVIKSLRMTNNVIVVVFMNAKKIHVVIQSHVNSKRRQNALRVCAVKIARYVHRYKHTTIS